jgi:hypothetical protein
MAPAGLGSSWGQFWACAVGDTIHGHTIASQRIFRTASCLLRTLLRTGPLGGLVLQEIPSLGIPNPPCNLNPLLQPFVGELPRDAEELSAA